MSESVAIPLLRLRGCLVVSIQVDLHDRLVLQLKDDVSEAISKRPTRALILDVSAVSVVDSFVARVLGDIAATAKLLGTPTVVVGIRPAVAMTLVELGITLEGIHTALDLETGLERLGIHEL